MELKMTEEFKRYLAHIVPDRLITLPRKAPVLLDTGFDSSA